MKVSHIGLSVFEFAFCSAIFLFSSFFVGMLTLGFLGVLLLPFVYIAGFHNEYFLFLEQNPRCVSAIILIIGGLIMFGAKDES